MAAATEALVLDGSNAKPDVKGQLQSLVSQWSAGNFKSLPQIVLLSDADISGAQGAYADSTDTIYLNADWLLTATEEQIQKVLTEELGHSLDDQLNLVDTKGDEGEYFSYQLFDGKPQQIQVDEFRSDDDQILIVSDKESISAEAASNWLQQAGGSAYVISYSITALGDGSSLVAGSFTGTATFGSTTLTSAGLEDIFIAKINQYGAYVWAVRAGGAENVSKYETGSDWAESISALADGSAVVTGRFNSTLTFGSTTLQSGSGSDAFIAKVRPDGLFEWASVANGTLSSANYGNCVSTLTNGSSIVTGSFTGTLKYNSLTEYPFSATLTSAGLGDVFISKLNSDGSFAWATRAGGTSSDGGRSISTFEDGSSIVVGTYNGGAATFGNTTLFHAGLQDIFISKVNPNGGFTWTSRAGGDSSDFVNSVDVQENGASVITGSFVGTSFFGSSTLTSKGGQDVFVSKLNSFGGFEWSVAIGGSGTDSGMSVSSCIDGSFRVAGVFSGAVMFGNTELVSTDQSGDIFVAKLNADGTFAWAINAGGIGQDAALEVVAQDDGSSLVTGYFTNTAFFGTKSLSSQGLQDSFVAKVTADGKWESSPPVINIGAALFKINGNGTGQDVQTLTCILDTLDPDGLIKLPPSKTDDPTNGYTYQWEISLDGSTNWTNATGAGNTTFKYSVNTTTDADKFLRVRVGYQDDKGFNEIVYTGTAKILSGTSKSDSFTGTAGIDVTFSGSGADAIATGAGNDFAKGGSGSDTFNGTDGDGDDFFDGGTEIDTLSYSASAKGVLIDFVTGTATERVLEGGIGKDTFANIENARGTTGDDVFTGNIGVNSFTGVNGKDTFRFINKQVGATACDRITDFSGDIIELSKAAFGLSSVSFASVSGTKAVNASAFSLVYDTGTGYLYLNTDGSVSGMGAGGGVIAILANKAALTPDNFNLI